MVERLANGLVHVGVTHGKYLEHITVFLSVFEADQALPSNGKLRDRLVDYIDDYPLIEFVLESLRRELADTKEYVSESSKAKLTEIDGYQDPQAIANHLISEFETLPWKYTLSLPVKREIFPPFPEGKSQVALGTRAQLIEPDLLLDETYPLNHPDKNVEERVFGGKGLLNIWQAGDQSWEKDSIYLQFEIDGYIGIYGGGSPVANVERSLESFFGLGLATRLFSYKYSFQNPDKIPEWLVHREAEGGWRIESKFKIKEDDSSVIRHISLWDGFNNDYPEEHKIPWLTSRLDQVSRIFSSDRADSLLLAAKWFFDSFKGSDDVLSYSHESKVWCIMFGRSSGRSV